jgi:alpha-ribazole phosphatase
MRLFLVRHGETDSNKKKIIQGHLDIELNDIGIIQAKNISERLKGHSFKKIFSSDLQRAKDTAKEIAKHHSIEIIYDKRLRERNLGNFSGKRAIDVDWDSLEGNLNNKKPLNGESWNDVINRAKEFIDSLDGEGDVLIVMHGGTIKALLHVLLERDIEELVFNYKPKNTALYVLEKRDGKFIPILENCDIHNN